MGFKSGLFPKDRVLAPGGALAINAGERPTAPNLPFPLAAVDEVEAIAAARGLVVRSTGALFGGDVFGIAMLPLVVDRAAAGRVLVPPAAARGGRHMIEAGVTGAIAREIGLVDGLDRTRACGPTGGGIIELLISTGLGVETGPVSTGDMLSLANSEYEPT